MLKLSKVLLLSGSELCSCWAHVHPAAPQFNTEQASVRSEDKTPRIPLMTSSTQDKSWTRSSGGDAADSLDVCRSFSLLTSVSGICPVKTSALLPSGTLAHVCRSGTAWAWSTHCKKRVHCKKKKSFFKPTLPCGKVRIYCSYSSYTGGTQLVQEMKKDIIQ